MPKKKPTTEVAEVVQTTATPAPMNLQSVESLISQAISQNVNVDVMERILNMRRELKAEWAKEQYVQAMAKFQAECPVIKKTKSVLDNEKNLAYKYAPLDSIILQTKLLIQKHGFSYSTEVDTTKPGIVKSTCIITHIAGHSERYEMEVPFGNKTRMMSDTQVTAAAATFAKRHAFTNGFGIMTGDEDVDGKDISIAPITDEQKQVNGDFAKLKKTLEDPKTGIGTILMLEGKLKSSTRYDKKQTKELETLIEKRKEELDAQPA